MKKLIVTPTEAKLLTSLCELGQTDLVARQTGLSIRTVETYLSRLLIKLGYPNRVTLALAWDRQGAKNEHNS
jgi:DNA-binding CsgD family transcriptional regulator